MIKMIIIDDEAIIRESLKHFIDWASIEVEVCGLAANGSEGIELILSTLPDIILSDINMPLLTGIELIEFLRKNKIKTEVIFISAYSRFEYAKAALHYSAFDYILKPIDEAQLLQTVLQCTQKIKQQQETDSLLVQMQQNQSEKVSDLMERLLCDQNYTLQDSEKNLLTKLQLFSESPKCCIAAGLFLPDGGPDLEVFSKPLQLFQQEHREFLLLPLDPRTLIIIQLSCTCKSTALEDSFQEQILAFCLGLSSDIPGISVTISNAHTFRDHFYELYTEVVLAQRLKEPEISHCTFRSIFHKAKINSKMPDVNQIFQNIKAKSNCIAAETTNRLFYHFVYENKIYDIDYIKLQCITFIDCFIHHLEELQLSKYFDSPMLSSKKSITSQKNIDSVYQVTLNILSNLILCVEDLYAKTSSHLIRSSIDYIHENYSKGITLVSAASHLYVSPAYLSKVFSAEMKQPFSKYLLCHRIERSKLMLRDTNYKISAIAELCGFSDTAHFSKSFKQTVGISPHHYRRDLIH